jgi:flagellar basal-body rod protein FlgG
MRVLSIAATGMQAQQTNVEVISNNIANMNTTAYKRSRAEFGDLMYQAERRQGAQSSDTGTVVPAGIEIGLGVRTRAVARIHAQGALTNTNNKLDLAMDGKGYFIVKLPNGDSAYTRAGSFQLSSTGEIVTIDGYTVQPGITVPKDTLDIVIDQTGQVQVTVANQTKPQNLGQLQIANFINEAGLQAMGDNLYKPTEASGDAQDGLAGQDGYGLIRQGYVEASNVNIVQEITSLISAQRAYEMNSKCVETADQMESTITNMRT